MVKLFLAFLTALAFSMPVFSQTVTLSVGESQVTLVSGATVFVEFEEESQRPDLVVRPVCQHIHPYTDTSFIYHLTFPKNWREDYQGGFVLVDHNVFPKYVPELVPEGLDGSSWSMSYRQNREILRRDVEPKGEEAYVEEYIEVHVRNDIDNDDTPTCAEHESSSGWALLFYK